MTRTRKIVVIAVVVIVALVVALAAVGQGYGGNIQQTLTVEAGQKGVAAEDFLVDAASNMPVSIVTDLSGVDFSVPDTHGVVIECGGFQFERTLKIEDTTPPTGEARNVVFQQAPTPQPEDFVTNIQDVSNVYVSFADWPDFTVPGERDVGLLLTDDYGNTTELTAVLTVLTVVPDTQAPEISGVRDRSVYVGSAIAYRDGVEVTDDMDEAPVLTVDSSQVDLSTPGAYTVIYTATDASGNVTRRESVVTVKEKLPGYADEAAIYAEVDQILDSIVTGSMSKREQVNAIYDWITTHTGYSGHADKSDWFQAAYVMMTERAGDCFNYFALSKLMFERLGIDNIDVVKVKNYEGDSNHYWSLVSLDDGETWYHFDATPRVGDGDYFCLVTDAVMDAYSATHQNCFNRDKSLYPATPEE